jgi:hypothetical protein
MDHSFTVLRRRFGSFVRIALLATAGALAGCGGDDDGGGGGGPGGGGPTTSTFTGIFANNTENGSMYVTINSTNLAAPLSARRGEAARRAPFAPLAVITASGYIKPIGGSTITLTGNYNDQLDSLNLTNVSAGYYFYGAYDTTGSFDAILGQYGGPNGPGFFGCVTGLSMPTTYCGTFDSDVSTEAGNWDLLVTGAEVAGIAFPTAGEPFGFEGTIETTGTMRDITAGDSDPGVYTLTVAGTLDTTTNTVSGTWTYEDLVTPSTDTGTWSGSLCPQ